MSQAHALKDMTGLVFGRLAVVCRNGSGAGRGAMWFCQCQCGETCTVLGKSLRRGATVSCGCHGREARAAANLTHGAAVRGLRHPEYTVWRAMKGRCENQNDRNFQHYGGRGITVCQAWSDNFAAFFADMGARPFPGATVERRDNSKGYSLDNCYWATMRQQARNRRSNVAVVRGDGVRFGTMVEAAEATGVHATGIRAACTGQQKKAGGFLWSFAAPLLTSLQDTTHAK